MSLAHDLEAAKQEMIALLLEEVNEINANINGLDAVRTKLLNDIFKQRIHFENAVKKLEQLGYDTSAL